MFDEDIKIVGENYAADPKADNPSQAVTGLFEDFENAKQGIKDFFELEFPALPESDTNKIINILPNISRRKN